jgi:hypothetical protein
MTPEQIHAYFGNDVVYIFNGTADDLHDLMVANDLSYNYITDGPTQIIYFVTTDGAVPQDSRISRM